MTMTLDEYRAQVVQNLRCARFWWRFTCRKAFWQSLNHDLNAPLHELRRPPEQSAGGARSASSSRHRWPLRDTSEHSRAMALGLNEVGPQRVPHSWRHLQHCMQIITDTAVTRCDDIKRSDQIFVTH